MRSDGIAERAPLGLRAAVVGVLLFLHLPFAIILLYAFTTEDASFRFPPPGLTLDWFQVAWNRPDIRAALGLSLRVACASTAIALVLGTVAFASLGLAMAGALRAEATLALANGVFLLFLVLGGIVLPIDHLRAPLEGIAGLLPAAALSEALRIGLGAATGSAVGPLALLAAWGAGAALVAARTFRWE